MITFKHFFLSFLVIVSVGMHGCELDTCKNVECSNNGVCLDGVCDCVGAYTGDNCDLENPFSFILDASEISLLRDLGQPVRVQIQSESFEAPKVWFTVENAPAGMDFSFSKSAISVGSTILTITARAEAVNGNYTINVVGTSEGGIRSMQELQIQLGNVVYDVNLTSSENSFTVKREYEYQEEYYFSLEWNEGPQQPISFDLLGAPSGTDFSFDPSEPSSSTSCELKLSTTGDVGQYPCEIVANLPNGDTRSLAFNLLVLPSIECASDLAKNAVTIDLSCQDFNPSPYGTYIGEGWNEDGEVRLGKPYGSNSDEIKAYLDCENGTVEIPSQTIEGVFDRTYEGSGTFNSTRTKITVTYSVVTPYFGGTDYDQCTAVFTH